MFFPIPRLASAAAVVVIVGASTAAQTQQLSVSSSLSAEVLGHQVAAAGPETDWNCLDIGIMETDFRSIMPNYQSGDPTYVTAMKGLAKRLWAETFFAAGGNVGTERDGGSIVGIEFDVFEGLNPGPAPGAYQLEAELLGVDASGASVDLGTLYLFTGPQWASRLADLEAAMGGVALSQYSVWRGATLFAAGTGVSMRMLGQANELIGDAYGGDQFRLGGQNWDVRDTAAHAGLYMQFGSGHQIGATASVGSRPTPTPFGTVAQYQSQAGSMQIFGGDLQILNDGNGGAMAADGTALSGVVYVAGDVSVDGSYMTATLTIVAGGSIDVTGGNNVLTAATDGLFAWSFSTDLTDSVSLDSSSNTIQGSFHAPSLELRVGGSSNTLTGRMIGSSFKVTGGSNSLSDGTD